jgi:hypothetical protein
VLTRQGRHFVQRRSKHFWALALVLVLGIAGGAAAIAGGRDAKEAPLRVVVPTTSTTTEPTPAAEELESTTSEAPTTVVTKPEVGRAPATSRPKTAATGAPTTKRPAPAGTSPPTSPPRATTTTSPYWPWGCYPFCEFDD